MSDVVLAGRYSADNYPLALENLAKRYRRKESDEAVNYSELGFGGLSEDQASEALRFFANIGLLENPKGANYIPSQSVLNWKLKMGETAEQGKIDTFEQLKEYEVFNELVFILEEGAEELDDLAEQVGGLVGIDEDELSQMKKTIEVFAACESLDIGDDNIVSLTHSPERIAESGESRSKEQSLEETVSSEPEIPDSESELDTDGIEDERPSEDNSPRNSQSTLNLELEISMNATEMDPDDLREKLEIVEEILNHDGE